MVDEYIQISDSLKNRGIESEANAVFISKTLRVLNSSVLFGNSLSAQEFGSILGFVSKVTNRTYMLPFQLWNANDGAPVVQFLKVPAGAPVDTVIAENGTENLTSPTFTVTSPGNYIVLGATFEATNAIDSVAFRVSSGNVPVKYYPDEFAWEAVTNGEAAGYDISAGVNTLDLSATPIILSTDPQIDYEVDSVSLVGDLVVKGAGTMPNLTFLTKPFAVETLADTTYVDEQIDEIEATMPVARTDEEIRDVVNSTFVQGENMIIDVDDENNTVTFTADATGGGILVTTLDGSFTANAGNIATWYGGRADVSLRMEAANNARRTFRLPDITDFNLMFDDLEDEGLATVYTLTLAYAAGNSANVAVNALTVNNAPVSPLFNRNEIPATLGLGDFITLRVTRNAEGNILPIEVRARGTVNPIDGNALDAIDLQTAGWNAADSTLLPFRNVEKGSAYKVFNAPADGTGRLGEVLYNDDWVVWEGDTFTSWSSEPHEWFVIPAHDVRRFSFQSQGILEQTTEVDTPFDTRASAVDNVVNSLVYLSPAPLTTAPFLAPGDDTSNPRAGQTVAYVGGTTNRDANLDFIFNGFPIYPGLLYVVISSAYFTAATQAETFVQFFDLDGNLSTEFNLADDFVKPVFADNSTGQYFVLSTRGFTDSFDEIRYLANQTVRIVHRQQARVFGFAENVDVTSNVNGLEETQLSQTARGKLNRDSALAHVDRVRLDAIEAVNVPTPIPSGLTFFLKYGDVSHVQSDYHATDNSNGIVGDFEAQPISVVVPDNAAVSELAWSRGAITVSEITPSLFDRTRTYTATIPAFSGSFSQSPLDFPISLAGTLETAIADGLAPSVKVDSGNLSEELNRRILDAGSQYNLPDNLARLNEDLTVTSKTSAPWKTLSNSYPFTLTRIGAALWDENRHDGQFGTGNYFEDITGIVLTYDETGALFYVDPNDEFNTEMPGFPSFLDSKSIAFTGTLSMDFTKLIKFKYRVKAQAFGGVARTPLLTLGSTVDKEVIAADVNGLVAVRGNQDGGTVTETSTEEIYTANGRFSRTFSGSAAQEEEWVVSETDTYTVNARLFANGNDIGVDSTNTLVISALDQDISTQNITFNFNVDGDAHAQAATLGYLAHTGVYSGLGHTLRIGIAQLTDNIKFDIDHLVVTVTRQVTITHVNPVTYSDVVIDSSTLSNDVGELIVAFVKTLPTSTDPDPFLSVRVVHNSNIATDDVRENNDINLNRADIELDFQNLIFGGDNVTVSQIETYEVSGTPPTHSQLHAMLNVSNIGLGLFGHPTTQIDNVAFDASVETAPGLILHSPDSKRWLVTGKNDGTLELTEVV